MSGIAGVISLSTKIEELRMQKALDLIHHRGPDNQTIVKKAWGLLGGILLRTLPENISNIAVNEKAGIFLAFDGSLLNGLDIIDTIGSRYVSSKKKSHAEILLELYEKFGTGAFERIIGHVSIAIIDTRIDKVFLVRDYFGVRPLYYQYGGGMLYFASEIKAITALNSAPPALNKDALIDYLTFQYGLDEKTLFTDVKKVKPGCYAEWDYRANQEPSVRPYWQIDFTADFNHTEKYFIDKTRELIEDAVRLSLTEIDSPGIFLSGGLDSSTVAAFGHRANPQLQLRTFCGRYAESKDYDESEYAQLVAEAIKSNHTDITLTADQFPDLMHKIIYLMDEPQAGPGVFGQYVVGREASRFVKVALSGEGGDEIFLGYAKYLIAYLEECLRGAILETANQNEFVVTLQSIVGNLPLLKSYTGTLQKFWKEGLFNSKENRYFDLCNRLREIDGLISSDVFSGAYDVEENFLSVFTSDNIRSHVNMMSRFDILTGLQAVLHVDERSTIAHSVENRIPLLDQRLVQLVASVPPKMKFFGGQQKYLLRKVIKDVVPQNILDRKDKMGFPIPINEWFAGPLKDFIHDILSTQKARERGIFTEQGLTELLKPQQQYGRALWGALNLELWLQTFIDG